MSYIYTLDELFGLGLALKLRLLNLFDLERTQTPYSSDYITTQTFQQGLTRKHFDFSNWAVGRVV